MGDGPWEVGQGQRKMMMRECGLEEKKAKWVKKGLRAWRRHEVRCLGGRERPAVRRPWRRHEVRCLEGRERPVVRRG